MHQLIITVLLAALAVGLKPAFAANEAEIIFKGMLVTPPPCAIDNSQTIHVPFGERLSIKKVSEGVYRKDIPYDLKCDNTSGRDWKLMLSVRGTLATFDTTDRATVATSVGNLGNLGVKILRNGQSFTFNSPVEISLSAMPKLEALLVQRPNINLIEGPFEATVTLRAEYL